MSTSATVNRDERTVAIENASYRWAYSFISFGLLVLVAFRSFMYNESPWDLMALVVVGGFLCTTYQWFHKVLTAQWAATVLLTCIAAGALAAIIAWLR